MIAPFPNHCLCLPFKDIHISSYIMENSRKFELSLLGPELSCLMLSLQGSTGGLLLL